MKTIQLTIKQIVTCSILVILLANNSCQKVIPFDMNSANPQLVVEATLSDKPGSCFVKLTKTVGLDDIANIPAVIGAQVTISDTLNHSDTLYEVKPGIYISPLLKGIPGQTYRLLIETEGKVIKAFSHMPYPVDFKALEIVEEKQVRPRFGNGGHEKKKRYQVSYSIEDPENYSNYYKFVAHHNNVELESRRPVYDQFHNGKLIIGEFRLNDTAAFIPGDTVIVDIQNIDKGAFDFFRTLRTGFGGMGFLSASPTNPVSNVDSDSKFALGYFSAYSVISRIAVVPKPKE